MLLKRLSVQLRSLMQEDVEVGAGLCQSAEAHRGKHRHGHGAPDRKVLKRWLACDERLVVQGFGS